eukprot:7312709-Prymnesium_polylepis.1
MRAPPGRTASNKTPVPRGAQGRRELVLETSREAELSDEEAEAMVAEEVASLDVCCRRLEPRLSDSQ